MSASDKKQIETGDQGLPGYGIGRDPSIPQQQPWYAATPAVAVQPGFQATGQGQQVVIQQPGVAGHGQVVVQWMPQPMVPIGCPPGLEYLTQVDQLLVKQQIEVCELLSGCEMNNKYIISNSLGQQVYFAAEDTECLTRICCGPGRPFNIRIMDNAQREVMHLYRPFRCGCCWFPCCLHEIEVCSPPGTLLGYVEQKQSLCAPRLELKDANRTTQLVIQGPICPISCFSDVKFSVLSLDETTEVASIYKQWTGLCREMFTDADNFGLTFPLDLDVKTKALMIGACFLIDFMFFEHNNNNN